MVLIVHPSGKSRLTEALTLAISQLKVENGRYIDRHDAREALEATESVLPGKGPLRTQLCEYIDDDAPVTEFIMGTLSEELLERPFTDIEVQPLSEIPSYADSHSVAERLVDRLIYLPNKYTLSFLLPPELSRILGSASKIDLSPHVRVVKAGEELGRLYPSAKMDDPEPGVLTLGLLGTLGTGQFGSVKWSKDGIYLQVDADGYIGPFGGSNPHLQAVRTLRAFCGLGLALGLFDVRPAYLPQWTPSDILIHRHESENVIVPFRAISLDDGVSRTVTRIVLSAFFGSLDSEFKRDEFADRVLSLMRIVFSGGKKADLIFLAAQWFFDGHTHGPDPLLKFIQTMIVLEILLGDKASSDQAGLNVLLRNRCAYLIGTSEEDRAKVLEWFDKIYEVRSRIVHSGKHRLSASEFELFVRLRWICRRVIGKEIDLLRANEGRVA